MRRAVILVPLVVAGLAGAPRAAPAAKGPPRLSDEEKAFCANELTVVQRRRQIFEARGLPEDEVARKNATALRLVAECRERFRLRQRSLAEQKEDMEEAARRAGPDATERERERAWREVRRERLASKSASELTPEEKAELAAGLEEEVAATHSALDSAHARDPAFMRIVHSAVACYHADRKAELENQLASEQALTKLGAGDRQKLYAFRSELRQSEEVLARSKEAARAYPGGLERCTTPTVAILVHCLSVRFEQERPESACESEQIQQYVRFVK